MNLDEHQLEAVKHFEGPALVVAGPGSGKTTVIKERILNLIREYDVNPSKILALAFNKEAAIEMERRVFSSLMRIRPVFGKPEISTLHSFCLKIINEHYERLNLESKPVVWATDPERTIQLEISQLKKEAADLPITVYIYKIGNKVSDKCYIGQTTNWKRRRLEHINESSNTELRQDILFHGKDQFNFDVIRKVKGEYADSCEAELIEYQKNLAVFNENDEDVSCQIDENVATVSIFKIENILSGRCFVGYSSNPRLIEDDFTLVQNDQLQQNIIDEGYEQFSFHIIHDNINKTDVLKLVEHEVESQKNRAVYNRSNPISQRYSNRLQVELFCQYFKLNYEDVIKHTESIDELSDKIDNYEKIVREVQKAKLQVEEDFSNYNSIDDVTDYILGSIDDIVVKTFAENYEEKKKRAKAIDFQDMILYAVFLFERYKDICTKWTEKYDYVLVDEFQDISPIDFRLIKTLSDNLFAVGDDDQAIYSFRGGDSEIMQNFHKNVKEYKIMKNYRSTMTIVNHSKTLIDHNKFRIQKNLHAKSTIRLPIKVFETTNETETPKTDFALFPLTESNQVIINQSSQQVTTVENMLMRELTSTVSDKTAILVRYRTEVDQIRKILRRKGFKEKVGSSQSRKKGGPYNFFGEGNEQIRVSTIHSVKGKEYNKVILIHNALDEDFPFYDSDNIEEERRVFYVAMTRAKRELIVIGGECRFVWELRMAHIPELERLSKVLKSTIRNRIISAEFQLIKTSEDLRLSQITQRTKQEKSIRIKARKQFEPEFKCLQSGISKFKDETNVLKLALPQKLKANKEDLIEKLIPIFKQLDSIRKNMNAKADNKTIPTEFTKFYQNVNSSWQQFYDLLKAYGIRLIETTGKKYNSNEHNSIRSTYHNEAPNGIIVEESSPGYLIDSKVIRKAQVIVSMGIKPLATKRSTHLILSQDFTQPVIFVTYKGCYYLNNVNILHSKIIGVDRRGPLKELNKVDVLFAFPYMNWSKVKPYLTMKTSVKDRNLQPIELPPEKLHAENQFLRSIHDMSNSVIEKIPDNKLKITTRAGYILEGCLLDFDSEVLHISLGGKTVIAYRHGILEIEPDFEIRRIKEKNLLKLPTKSSPTIDSECTAHSSESENGRPEIDAETHSQILKEQIRKLDVTSEQLVPPIKENVSTTNETCPVKKTESEISNDKNTINPQRQEKNKSFSDFLRQICDFFRKTCRLK